MNDPKSDAEVTGIDRAARLHAARASIRPHDGGWAAYFDDEIMDGVSVFPPGTPRHEAEEALAMALSTFIADQRGET